MRAFPGNTTVEEIESFDEDQIKEAFNLLLERAPHGGYRLCFFIDGLDECEGNRLKHEELALKLQSWTASGAVKLCVSSRPYSEFSEPLRITKNQTIQLHELNESDIRAYCIYRLDNDIHARERGELCRDLAAIVVERAQGVFLWVHLVIDKLLIGLRQADPDYVLRAEVEALPRDLDLLYTKLREPIQADSIQRDRSNRMLLLAAKNPCDENLTAMAFSWLEEQSRDQGGLMNPDFPPRSELKPYSEEETSERIDRVTKQINGLARGFLEVRYTRSTGENPSFFAPQVQFCHRTARDYLLHNENRHCDLLESFPNFEESSVYTRIRLAEIIHGYASKEINFRSIFRNFRPSFLNNIDPDLVDRFELAVRGLLVPMWHFSPSSSASPDHKAWVSGADRASFTEFAAFRGLSRFLFREVTKDTTKLGGTSSCGSILLAAVAGRQYRLTSELLTLSRGKNQLCEVRDEHGNVQSPVPACVLATAHALANILGTPHGKDRFFSTSRFREEDFILATELLRFSISLEISLRITVVGAEELHGGRFYKHDPEELQVQIDAAEAVTLLDCLGVPENGIAGSNAVVVRRRRIMEAMSIWKLGRVVDEGAQMTHRLKEWPDEPHAFFTGGVQKKACTWTR